MQGSERRSELLRLISESDQPVSGAKLAKYFQVSRQVIVQDIALLRAQNCMIVSTNRGYLTQNNLTNRAVRVFWVRHGSDRIEEELNMIVDCGATVLDVGVAHEIYGSIRADLQVACREDTAQFLRELRQSGTKPLTELTGGVHCHTVAAKSEEVLDLVEAKLTAGGFVYNA